MTLREDQQVALEPERRRLIEAMARCCARLGYPETSIDDVVRQARLSREDFDRHFASREECAMAAVETILAEGMAAVSVSYSADNSEWESALQALRALLELFAARPSLAALAMVHSRQLMPAAALAHHSSGFAILTAMLDRLRANQVGKLRPPSAAARAAIGGGEALVRREIVAGRTEELPRLLPTLVYGATVPFLGPEEALRLARRGRQLLRGTAWEVGGRLS